MIAAALVALAVSTGLATWTIVDRHRFALGRRVVVNLRSGKAVEGVLTSRRGDVLLLRAGRLFEPGAEPVAIDGETMIERRTVDFVQLLTSPEEG